jgi:hypothetical protein
LSFSVGAIVRAWGIGGLEVLAGICVTGTFTLWETSLQEHVRDRALSRVSSYDYLTSAGVIPLGNVLVGAVGAALGVATLPPVRNLPRRVLGQRVARL